MKRIAGFTLIELMIVIALIATVSSFFGGQYALYKLPKTEDEIQSLYDLAASKAIQAQNDLIELKKSALSSSDKTTVVESKVTLKQVQGYLEEAVTSYVTANKGISYNQINLKNPYEAEQKRLNVFHELQLAQEAASVLLWSPIAKGEKTLEEFRNEVTEKLTVLDCKKEIGNANDSATILNKLMDLSKKQACNPMSDYSLEDKQDINYYSQQRICAIQEILIECNVSEKFKVKSLSWF